MGPGSAPAERGPTLRVPSGDTQAIEPPPAPTVTMSIIGTLAGKRPTVASVVREGAPDRMTATSVDVPPPSSVTTSSNPAAWVTAAAPSAPAAGPDSTVVMGFRATWSADVTPPLDFMTKNGTPPAARAASCAASRSTYLATDGLTKASTRVVTERSYSRYSRSTSELIDTQHSG